MPGAKVILVKPDGEEHEGEIESVSPKNVVATFGRRLPRRRETLPTIILAQAVVKGERMDWLVQKVAEVGVARLIPFLSQRTVVRLDEKRAAARRERWQKIADQAARQSLATSAMRVEKVVALPEAVERLHGVSLLLVAYEEEEVRDLRQALRRRAGPDSAAVFVGPEGGFTPEEIEELRGAGGTTITLGPQLLRAETAAIVASAFVLRELDLARRAGRR